MNNRRDLKILLMEAQSQLFHSYKQMRVSVDVEGIVCFGSITAEYCDDKGDWTIKVWEDEIGPDGLPNRMDTTVSAATSEFAAAQIMIDLAFTQIAEEYWERIRIIKESTDSQ